MEFDESESLIGDPVDFGVADLVVDGGELDVGDAIESALGECELFDQCFLAGALGLEGLPPVIGFGADFIGVFARSEKGFRGHTVLEGIGAGFEFALDGGWAACSGWRASGRGWDDALGSGQDRIGECLGGCDHVSWRMCVEGSGLAVAGFLVSFRTAIHDAVLRW